MKTFLELNVVPEIVKAIEELGFEHPMPVQEQVIPMLLSETSDIIALAQTGTGKTAAFGLPIIQQVDPDLARPQALILSPTRELCIQIADDLTNYAKYMDKIKILPVYGGSNIESQMKALQRGVQIIVATPGRLIDLIERKSAKLDTVSKIVLDEADEMLNMGFSESIDKILSHMPKERNTLLFSATMPQEIANIARKYMVNPKEITVGTKNSGAENVKHILYTVHAKDKYLTLKRIADYYPNIYGIVFCRTRRETQEVADKLINDGYNAEALHGDLSQTQRDLVMQKFRVRNLQLLVATDVAARGIDVDDLTHVINYNLPEDIDAYTHRSGRTGRAGKAGISICIVNMKEKFVVKQIEKKIGKQFINAQVPNGKDVCEKQLFNLIEKLERIEVEHTDIEPYLPMIYRKLEWMDKEEIIQRFVSIEFNRFLNYYRDAADLNQSAEKMERRRGDMTGGPDSGFVRLYLNVGRIDGLYPQDLINFLRDRIDSNEFDLGRINIRKNHTLFDVDEKAGRKMLTTINGLKVEGRKLVLKIDAEAAPDKGNQREGKKFEYRAERSDRSERSGRSDRSDRSDRSSSRRRESRGRDRY